jgi:hypothetical protein
MKTESAAIKKNIYGRNIDISGALAGTFDLTKK